MSVYMMKLTVHYSRLRKYFENKMVLKIFQLFSFDSRKLISQTKVCNWATSLKRININIDNLVYKFKQTVVEKRKSQKVLKVQKRRSDFNQIN